MTELKINTYPLHIGDWHSGTSRMSLAEAGAYIRLCNQYYLDQGEGWTINECQRICAAMAKDEQKAVKAVLSAKFQQTDGGYSHEGMDKRIAEIQAASERNQERARRAANARHHGREKQCSEDATSAAPSMPEAVLEKCDPKAKSQKPVIDDGDGKARDAFGWPVSPADWPEAICAETGCADMTRNPKSVWPISRQSIEEIRKWHDAGIRWETVVEVIRDLIANKRDGPPNSMAYFTRAMTQSHANRRQALSIPEAQAHERRNDNSREPGQGRPTDYLRAAIDLDHQRRSAKSG